MCPDPLSFEQGQGHIVILNNIVIIKARPIEGEGDDGFKSFNFTNSLSLSLT